MNDTPDHDATGDEAAPRPAPTGKKGKKKPGLEDVILALCIERGPGKTIAPADAARVFAEGRPGEGGKWQHWIGHVRTASVGLARVGKIGIYRKGKLADPEDFRGLYRLGLPPEA